MNSLLQNDLVVQEKRYVAILKYKNIKTSLKKMDKKEKERIRVERSYYPYSASA